MKKVYEFKRWDSTKELVTLGDEIYIHSVPFVVTEQLINALPVIFKEHKKDLEYYENLLLQSENEIKARKSPHLIITFHEKEGTVWKWIKDNHPTVFYKKVLELIADDLNEGKSDTGLRYVINNNLTVKSVDIFSGKIYGCSFIDLEDVKSAIEIMGDKLKYAV